MIARAIVVDDEGCFYFVRANRDDDFGKATLIETAGGGVEAGEDLNTAIRRELKEELGADVEVLCKIGVVSDYYNLIHRHNINNYFLCKVKTLGDKHLTQDEIEDFHLSTLKLGYEEALVEYERCRCTSLGRLVANREVPVLKRAKELLQKVRVNITVRTAQKADYGAVKRIMDQVQQMHVDWRPDIYRPNENLITEEVYTQMLDSGNFYVAEADGKVAGVLEVEYKHIESPAHVTRDIVFIDSMAVDEPYRNMGIGHLFFEKVKELKSAKHADGIELQVNARNKAAYEMYKKYGFTEKSINMELGV